MELSLGFHMIFAAIGIAMPAMMLIAERRWIRHRGADALALARMWARLTAVTFAIGAVSGTALSFELGLLWPRFMAFAGPLIGPAFALEGFAFFVEAIMVGAAMAMLVVAAWYWWTRWRTRGRGFDVPLPRLLLASLVLCAPLGFVALEAGWVVTEVGRQPWGIYDVMRTADAATPVTDVWQSLALFSALYAGLLVLLGFFLWKLATESVSSPAHS